MLANPVEVYFFIYLYLYYSDINPRDRGSDECPSTFQTSTHFSVRGTYILSPMQENAMLSSDIFIFT
jgi:hypothetical protein